MPQIPVSKIQSNAPYTNRSKLLLEFKENLNSICLDNKKNEYERVKLVEQIMDRSTSLISLERQLKMLVDKIRYENSWLNISSGHSKLTLALTKIISKYSQETRIIYLENVIKNQHKLAETIKNIHLKETQKMKEDFDLKFKQLSLIITDLSVTLERLAKINDGTTFVAGGIGKKDEDLPAQIESMFFHMNNRVTGSLSNHK